MLRLDHIIITALLTVAAVQIVRMSLQTESAALYVHCIDAAPSIEDCRSLEPKE